MNVKKDLVQACKALLCMMDRGDKPQKLDAALTWRENGELAREMARIAIENAEKEVNADE